jgi:hypothetical protein
LLCAPQGAYGGGGALPLLVLLALVSSPPQPVARTEPIARAAKARVFEFIVLV